MNKHDLIEKLMNHFEPDQIVIDVLDISMSDIAYNELDKMSIDELADLCEGNDLFREINGEEYMMAREWLATVAPEGEHVLNYLGDGEHDPRIDKKGEFVGCMYRDDTALYEKAGDNGEYLHVADIDWKWVDKRI